MQRCSSALPLLAALALGMPARAQEAPAGPVALAPVTVELQRAPMNLLELPTAASVMQEADMTALQVRGFEGAALMTPNMNVQRRFGTGSGPLFSLRGLDAGATGFETDQRIALYLDDVYMGRFGALSTMAWTDLCGMNTLRGPQGTLFGRNAEAGVIELKSCAPHAEPGAALKLGLSPDGSRRAVLSLDSGRHSVGLAVRLSLLRERAEGYVRNTHAGSALRLSEPFGTLMPARKFGGSELSGLALNLSYQSASGLRLGYRYDRSITHSAQPAVQLLGLYGGIAALYDPALATGGAPPSFERRDAIASAFNGTDHQRQAGHALTASWNFSPALSLKYIASLRRMNEHGGGNDVDGAALNGRFLTLAGIPTEADAVVCYLCTISVRSQSLRTQELRLLLRTGPWDLSAGLFTLREASQSDSPTFIGARFSPASINAVGRLSSFVASDYYSGTQGSVRNRSAAVFAHLDYRASEALTLGLGLRHSQDHRLTDLSQSAGGPLQAERRDDFNDGALSAQYRFGENVQAYARLASGHMPGGVQGGRSFMPEASRSAELGFKAELLEHSLRLQGAVFQARQNSPQLLQFSPSTGSYTINGLPARQRGFELELEARASRALSLHASYGQVSSRSDSGFQPLSPPRSAYLGGEYRFAALPGGALPVLRVDASWHDRAAPGACDVGQSPTREGCAGLANPALTAAAQIPARTQLALRLSLDGPGWVGFANTRVSLWVRNALDSRKLAFARDMGNGTVVGSFEQPRSIGLDLDLDF